MRLQSALDATLRTPSHLKVLRVLTRFPSKEFAGRELAENAKASAPQAISALKSLEMIGIVQRRKAGAATLWWLQREHVLVPPLQTLFRWEEELGQDLIKTIRSGLSAARVTRAVLFGSFARGEESVQSDVDLFVEVATEGA